MSTVAQHDDQLLTVSEAAALLRVSTSTVRRRYREGELTGLRIGRQIRLAPEVARPEKFTQPARRPAQGASQ